LILNWSSIRWDNSRIVIEYISKMKKLIGIFLLCGWQLMGQPLNYYESMFGLDSNFLKAGLHQLIQDHSELDYETVKSALRQTDQDTSNANHIVLLYTGNSISKWNFANNPSNVNQQDYWNREHVWPKSHGDFGPSGMFTEKGANTDIHHLRPVDMTINSARSYKDFDDGGQVVLNGLDTTACYSSTNSWEPRDEVKGDVARMLFYMATRYEGGMSEAGDVEPDLELVNSVGTFPNAWMGRLSTLLLWHEADPVDAWEMGRNDIIFNWQGNRNPFIDHPEYVDIIWSTGDPSAIQISSVVLSPEIPGSGDSILVSASIGNPFSSFPEAVLYWGNSWDAVIGQENVITMMLDSGLSYAATIPPQLAGEQVYFKIDAFNGMLSDTVSFTHSLKISLPPFDGVLTAISTVQGQAMLSPFAYQITDNSGTLVNEDNGEISVTGIVTSQLGDSYFIQDFGGPWNGIYVYQSGFFPQIGDSIIVSGKVKEFYGLTEIVEVSEFYAISAGNELPMASWVQTGDVTAGGMYAEQYESTIVEVPVGECTSEVQSFGLWKIDDGSGEVYIHNTSSYGLTDPELGDSYRVSGVLNYNYSSFKIDLRFSDDVGAPLDLIPPTILSAFIFVNGKITVVFSEPLTNESAEDYLNYHINNDCSILSAEQDPIDSSIVYLYVDDLSIGEYELIVDGCMDYSGNIVSDSVELTSSFSNIGIFEEPNNSWNVYSEGGKVYFNSLIEGLDLVVYSLDGRQVVRVRNSGKAVVFGLDKGVYVLSMQYQLKRKELKLMVK